MGFYLDCPLDPLQPSGLVTCQEHIGQIQRIILQEKQSAASFANEAALSVLGNWTTLLSAVDNTIAVPTSIIDGGLVIPATEPVLTTAGSDETFEGLPISTGKGNSTRATGNFRGLNSTYFKTLKQYMDYNNLTAYFVLEGNRLLVKSYNGTSIEGLPMYAWSIQDPDTQGKNTHTMFPFSFALPTDWYFDTKIVKVDITTVNLLTIVNS